MALLLVKLVKGVSANYHKISLSTSDFERGVTTVVVGLYVDAQARMDDVKGNCLQESFIDLNLVSPNRTQMYAALKDLPAFSGAVDV